MGRTNSPTSARRGDGLGYIRIWATPPNRLVFWDGAPSTSSSSSFVEIGVGGEGEVEYSKEPMPKLEGLEPDFWEGPQWNAFGFFVQYLWAFGILFGVNITSSI